MLSVLHPLSLLLLKSLFLLLPSCLSSCLLAFGCFSSLDGIHLHRTKFSMVTICIEISLLHLTQIRCVINFVEISFNDNKYEAEMPRLGT